MTCKHSSNCKEKKLPLSFRKQGHPKAISVNQDYRPRGIRIIPTRSGHLTIETFGDWFGLAPEDSPLFARDISTQEIYALDMEWPLEFP
jgi:hypothetical protein